MPISVKDNADKLSIRNALLDSAIFLNLPLPLQKKLYDTGSLCRFQKGNFLFMEGENLNFIYYIVSGICREYYSDESGQEYLRRIHNQDSYISLHSVANREKIYNYSCLAVKETICFTLPKESFLKLADNEPKLGLNIASVLSGEYEDACRKNCLCNKTQATARVAGYLLKKISAPAVVRSLTAIKPHAVIDLRPLGLFASDISLSRETFSRILTEFHLLGVIDHQRGVVNIIDEKKLKVICGLN